MSHKNEYGCLMVLPSEKLSPHIIKYGKTVVPPDILYTEPDDDGYGYSDEPHITSKFGFTNDLSIDDIKDIIKGIAPFIANLKSLTHFKNDRFNVAKFDVEAPELTELNKRCNLRPNRDEHPVYSPHMTLAYIKPTHQIEEIPNLNMKIPIERVKYSGIDGRKFYLNLQ